MVQLDSYFFTLLLKRYPAIHTLQLLAIFVKACDLLCQYSISIQQLNEEDELLLKLYTKFEQLYGKCTINLHLHGHQATCITDYGSVYVFWLFHLEV